MTKQQMESIRILRENNYSFAAIAEATQLNENTVRAACSRNKIKPVSRRKRPTGSPSTCPYCGGLILRTSNQPKRFCSDRCRLYYWRSKQND